MKITRFGVLLVICYQMNIPDGLDTTRVLKIMTYPNNRYLKQYCKNKSFYTTPPQSVSKNMISSSVTMDGMV